jgi:hypothetical protein
MLTDLLWRGYPLVGLRRFEGGFSVCVCEDHGRNINVRACRLRVVVASEWLSGACLLRLQKKLKAQQAQPRCT